MWEWWRKECRRREKSTVKKEVDEVRYKCVTAEEQYGQRVYVISIETAATTTAVATTTTTVVTVIRFCVPWVISSSWAAMASFLLFSLLFSLSPSMAPITSFSNSTVQCEVVLRNKSHDFTDNNDSNNESIQYAQIFAIIMMLMGREEKTSNLI